MKSLVLLSGGLDSTVNLLMALENSQVELAITFDYGQRAASKEISASRAICAHRGVRHQVLDLGWLGRISGSALNRRDVSLPVADQVEIDSVSTSLKTAKAVWVPNRNGVFLNVAAAFAESLHLDCVVPGFNAEEAGTFPDNSMAYLESLNVAFSFSTSNRVQVVCWTTHMDKIQIWREGERRGLQAKELWTCYEGEAEPCGVCESCQRFARARRSL